MSSESLPDPRHDLAAYEQAVYWRYVRQHQQERDDAALARALQAELDAEGQIGQQPTQDVEMDDVEMHEPHAPVEESCKVIDLTGEPPNVPPPPPPPPTVDRGHINAPQLQPAAQEPATVAQTPPVHAQSTMMDPARLWVGPNAPGAGPAQGQIRRCNPRDPFRHLPSELADQDVQGGNHPVGGPVAGAVGGQLGVRNPPAEGRGRQSRAERVLGLRRALQSMGSTVPTVGTHSQQAFLPRPLPAAAAEAAGGGGGGGVGGLGSGEGGGGPNTAARASIHPSTDAMRGSAMAEGRGSAVGGGGTKPATATTSQGQTPENSTHTAAMGTSTRDSARDTALASPTRGQRPVRGQNTEATATENAIANAAEASRSHSDQNRENHVLGRTTAAVATANGTRGAANGTGGVYAVVPHVSLDRRSPLKQVYPACGAGMPCSPDAYTAEIACMMHEQELRDASRRAARECEDAAVAALIMHEAHHLDTARRKAVEERDAQEAMDALAAARLQEEEREQIQAARAAQAQADLNVARLLDSVSERTRQDVADLDRTAALADHEKGATFECPILFIECNKRDEGVCIGLWNHHFCNHWISRDALVQYIVTEAEDGRFSFPCPICATDPCPRCIYHAPATRPQGAAGAPRGASGGAGGPAGGGPATAAAAAVGAGGGSPSERGCCYITAHQVRGELSSAQMERVLELEEKAFRTVNCDTIVQCPHPDCDFFYVVAPEDMAYGALNMGTGDAGPSEGRSKWREGRDMWCNVCEVRYCLHCGERTGTLVKWHATQTCTQFLEEALASRETAERRKLAAQADAGHEENRGKTWQRCPACRYEAWKPDDQCNRIVCRCGVNFCFLCGEDITVTRYQHFAQKHHPCYGKVWHKPLAGPEGRPPCQCSWCTRYANRAHRSHRNRR